MTNFVCCACKKQKSDLCLVSGTAICPECLDKAAKEANRSEDPLNHTVVNLIKDNDPYV